MMFAVRGQLYGFQLQKQIYDIVYKSLDNIARLTVLHTKPVCSEQSS